MLEPSSYSRYLLFREASKQGSINLSYFRFSAVKKMSNFDQAWRIGSIVNWRLRGTDLGAQSSPTSTKVNGGK